MLQEFCFNEEEVKLAEEHSALGGKCTQHYMK